MIRHLLIMVVLLQPWQAVWSQQPGSAQPAITQSAAPQTGTPETATPNPATGETTEPARSSSAGTPATFDPATRETPRLTTQPTQRPDTDAPDSSVPAGSTPRPPLPGATFNPARADDPPTSDDENRAGDDQAAESDIGTTFEPRTPTRISNEGSLLGTPFPAAQPASASESKDKALLRELLLVAPDLEVAKEQQQQMKDRGLRIRRRTVLENLGLVLSVFNVPQEFNLLNIAREIQSEFPDYNAEINRRYVALNSEARRYGQRLIELPETGTCGSGIRLAMLDTHVADETAKSAQSRLHIVDVTQRTMEPHRHGSAIVHLLIGAREQGGLLPHASLVAINVFYRDSDGKPVTNTSWLLAGLDAIAGLEPEPHAVNLSIGGGYSALLSWAFRHLHERIWFVAAGGNDGKSAPVYPAAYPEVIAVSAIDHRQRRYRKSNKGEFIDFSAPGVDIWSIDESGQGFYGSGTSFATPFVTALLALNRAAGKSLEEVAAAARDLGAPGKDALFGHGLITYQEGCNLSQ